MPALSVGSRGEQAISTRFILRMFSSEGLEFTEHGRDQLRDSGVDVDGALDGGVGRASVHDVQDAVNGFVTAGAENRCAEDFFSGGINKHLHKALRFSLFH